MAEQKAGSIRAGHSKARRKTSMPMKCNIDTKGKAIRLVYGFALAIAGALLTWLWALGSASPLAWIVCLALLAGGAFAIFEGWSGWCVIRALGFRTPI